MIQCAPRVFNTWQTFQNLRELKSATIQSLLCTDYRLHYTVLWLRMTSKEEHMRNCASTAALWKPHKTHMPCPVLSCPVLSCPVLSCPVLSCPVLSCPVLSCPVLSCSVLHSADRLMPACRYTSDGVITQRVCGRWCAQLARSQCHHCTAEWVSPLQVTFCTTGVGSFTSPGKGTR